MENRNLIIGDSIFGCEGEIACRCAELLLCREPNRPIQFSINAPVSLSLKAQLERLSSDVIGKKAFRIVMGFGLNELRRDGASSANVIAAYESLLREILKKTFSMLSLVTIPEDLWPDASDEICKLNDFMLGFAREFHDRVNVYDFASHSRMFKEKQAERGKFARSLYDENGKYTSLCITLFSLFLQECMLKDFNNKE